MTCRDCQRTMRPCGTRADGHTVGHVGRGLCERCYRSRRLAGTLTDVERLTHTRDELVQEYQALGETLEQAAARLGVTHWALRKALQRARVAA